MEQDSDPKPIGDLIEDPQTRTQTFTCENTGVVFEAEQSLMGGDWWPHYRFCPEEVERLIAEEEAEERRRRREAWIFKQNERYDKTCPPLMKNTDISRLQQAQLKTVLDWKYQPKGMILHGITGAGKTRIIWVKLKQISDEGSGWTYFQSRKLQDVLLKSVFDKTHDLFMKQLTQTRLLVIDDLGKEKAGDKWVTDLFDIVDRRCEAEKPTFITTNYNGEKLTQKYLRANPENDETCEALLRRLREFYISVPFKKSIQ